jgi:Fe2+ or Zn2+ uptake regulation protein
MKSIQEQLKEKGITPSLHRIKILEYLLNTKSHPTADRIYQSLIQEIPSLSKTTVYNTLKYFLSNNLIQSLTIDETEVRYDADLSFHAHFKCNHCGSLYDIEDSNMNPASLMTIEGHKVLEYHLYLKGICKKCLR